MSSLIVTPVLATPQEDAQSLETQKEELEGQAADINSQLVGLLVSYDALQKDMADQEQKITQAQSDLEEAQAKEQKQYEDMKLRIKYIYEQGDTSAFEAAGYRQVLCGTGEQDGIRPATYIVMTERN